MRPIAINDWRSLRRDPGSLVGLMMPMAMMVFLVMSSGGSSDGGFLVPYLMFTATSPAMSAFSSDRGAFALLREAPLSAGRLLASKYVSNLLPALIIVMLAMTAIALLTHMSMRSFAWVLLASVAVACILVAVHIALAARGLTATRRGAGVVAGGILMVIALDVAIAGPTGVLIGAMAGSPSIPSAVRTPAGTVVLLMLEVLSMAGLARLLVTAAKRIERWEPTG